MLFLPINFYFGSCAFNNFSIIDKLINQKTKIDLFQLPREKSCLSSTNHINQFKNKKMSEDMRKALLNKKQGAFDKPYQQCLQKIQRIKQKNDFLQKQVGTDVQDNIKKEVSRQKDFIEKQIKDLKGMMQNMDKQFKDPQSKNKIRNLKADAQKQIQRNKVILKEFINKSFLKISQGNSQDDDIGKYMQGGKVSYDQFKSDGKAKGSPSKRRGQNDLPYEKNTRAESLLTDQSLGIDFQIERKIVHERKVLIDEVQQTTYRINAIMNDMAIEVNEQGDNLDIISQEMMRSNKNLIESNKELDQANKLQKKSRRKYILFALVLIILICGGVGAYYFTR